MLAVTSNITVMAATMESHNIKSVIYDESGQRIVEYDSENCIPTSIVTNAETAKGTAPFSLFRTAPHYQYTLGGYNQNSFARARSESDIAIDKMRVTCYAWRDYGEYIGSDTRENPAGTLAGSISATVKPIDIGLDYKVGSAESSHLFRCSGYEDVNGSLKWNR